MKPWRLTFQAQRSLVDIAEWTASNFGEAQALAYRDALISRLNHLASGKPPHPRPCDVLMQGRREARGLLYFREGRHFIILRESDAELVVLDFLHERQNLIAHVERLWCS